MKKKKAAKAGSKRKRTVVRDLASRKPSDIKAGIEYMPARKSVGVATPAEPVASKLRIP